MMNFVVEFEHPPNLCPHSNALARKGFEDGVEGGVLDALAEKLGVGIVFAGIAVPLHKTYMVLSGPDYAAVRSLFVQSGIVQTNSVQIHVTESFAEFAEEIKGSAPIF
jgi:hypothetical protein